LQVVKHEGRTPIIFIEVEATTDNKEYRFPLSALFAVDRRIDGCGTFRT
jgi:hypothetical protein